MTGSPSSVTKAVILARGLGTRMRRDDGAGLDPEQSRAAAEGTKGMIPFGRPFLDYVLSVLADAGFREACLVIGPEHRAIREYYERTRPPERIQVQFAVQEQPKGTADAVAAARDFAGDQLFLVVNSDNYYPVEALRALRELGRPGLAAFSVAGLLEGNVDAARVQKFALLRLDPEDHLVEVVEKPEEAVVRGFGPDPWVSMNCWLFPPAIFTAAARVGPSPRGEWELVDAVREAMALGVCFQAVRCHGPVLDLSSRADVAEVARLLEPIEARP